METRAVEAKPCCPGCRSASGYQLGDGRRKCRRCGRKFTPMPLRSRLPAGTLRLIAIYFWHMVPAVRVAEDLALNRKTVQRHYQLLRHAICRGPETGNGKDHQFGPPAGAAAGEGEGTRGGEMEGRVGRPVFALTLRGSRIRIDFRPHPFQKASSDSWKVLQRQADALFYAGSARSLQRVELADFYFAVPEPEGTRGVPETPAREVLVFWDFARRLRKLHRGRGPRHLPTFFREVEFRFNNRDNPEILQLLCGLLKGGGIQT